MEKEGPPRREAAGFEQGCDRGDAGKHRDRNRGVSSVSDFQIDSVSLRELKKKPEREKVGG